MIATYKFVERKVQTFRVLKTHVGPSKRLSIEIYIIRIFVKSWRTGRIHIAHSKVVQQWPIYYIDGNVTLNSKSITTITH